MTIQEALGMMWRSHIHVIVSDMNQIDNTRWSPEEKHRQKRQIFDNAVHEFAERGWATAEAYLRTVHSGDRQIEDERKARLKSALLANHNPKSQIANPKL